MIPLRDIPGIGEKRLQVFKRMGIATIEDLIGYYPRAYQDLSAPAALSKLEPGTEAAFLATIASAIRQSRPRPNLTYLSALASDGTKNILLVWFNMPYIKNQLTVGRSMMFYGRIVSSQGKLQCVGPQIYPLPETGSRYGILPVYALPRGIKQKTMRSILRECLNASGGTIKDIFPSEFRQEHGLCEINYALENIHFPIDAKAREKAARRLAFEELLLFQMALIGSRRSELNKPGISFKPCETELNRFFASLPYRLTRAQARVWSEVLSDMRRPVPMNRLIQGDVGSGKTVLAAAALLLAVKNGKQGALMVPTEILALQHEESICRMLEPLGVRVGLLLGSMSAARRRETREAIARGTLDVLIGTHALIQGEIRFHDLGLAVVDEQHRFGVRQRALLVQKGRMADMLVMSATPIPRTLALILYGDLDISVIDELPPGRMPVMTRLVPENKRPDMLAFIRSQVGQGRQAYIVCPLVEPGEVRSAEAVYEELKTGPLRGIRLGLLHGQQKSADKERALSGFARGEIDVLISTTVVEVGVNVPNAAVMAVEEANRFGLAQIHQLRGRVGRGAHQSYCFLLPGEDAEASERLKVLCQSQDGFYIAEKDMQQRGPGEFFGMRQHGMPDLRFHDLKSDLPLIQQSNQIAKKLLADGRREEFCHDLIEIAKNRMYMKLSEIVMN